MIVPVGFFFGLFAGALMAGAWFSMSVIFGSAMPTENQCGALVVLAGILGIVVLPILCMLSEWSYNRKYK